MKHPLALVALALLLAPLAARAADEPARLASLFAREWESRLKNDPQFATSVGRHEYDDRLASITPAELARQAAEARAFLTELDAIDRAKLSPEDQVNADIFRRQLEDGLSDYQLGAYQMPFNADSGFHTEFSRLAEEVPLATTH
ncbi:MAG TPA: DUF885 family protein, partial [Thermoanaerobaculia bacterium]